MFRHLMHALLLLLPLACGPAAARGVYQTPEAFLDEVFAGQVPEARVLWLRGEIRAGVKRILGHRYPSLRIRYWQRGPRTAWILEEIGKEQPITTGVVVENGRIERIRVLVFRESRGYEVRHEFFTRQFDQAGLDEEGRLDRHIDNISGATLSVRAMKKLARLALFLDRQIRKP
ncbi:FMN-binding protein [Thiohalobacter sp.]|uniref:FMN-binding protein n=1 Tax=Thiohalobacter sp. TaxID=2025948 RepID=UPI0026197FCA|nr:FMN-binding protein [Thiohalobacter sp.]